MENHMRYLICLLLLVGACASVPLPGKACLAETVASVGSRIRMDDGRYVRVERVHGRSRNCRESARPILADVKDDG